MNPLHAVAIWLGARPWLPRIARLVVVVDKGLYRVTRGRLTLMASAGLPSVTLTVVGRRTGQPHTIALLGVWHGSGWLVAGSNFGSDHTPAWVANLQAAGRATVTQWGIDIPVVPRLAVGAHRAELWTVLVRAWPSFGLYAQRTTREIPVFVLTPRRPADRLP
jgi:deazaflavin-dependent oxidoreductase (nitroreductase family)